MLIGLEWLTLDYHDETGSKLMTRRRKGGGWIKTLMLLVVLLGVYAATMPGVVPTIGPLVAGRETVSARFIRCGSGPNNACVHDGDTIRINGRKIRLLGIDAPELADPKCRAERELAERAARRLITLLNAGPFDMVTDIRDDRDQYGRELKRLEREGRSIGDMLINEGLAQPYLGRKGEWC